MNVVSDVSKIANLQLILSLCFSLNLIRDVYTNKTTTELIIYVKYNSRFPTPH